MSPRSLTWEQIHRRRLARTYLATPAPRARLVDVVRACCGIHAQILTAAELSLGIRVAGITQHRLRDELWERRSLVKTYGPRGTLHLLPADELPVWMAAMRGRQALSGSPWYDAPGPPPDAPGLPMSLAAPLGRERGAAMLEAIGDALDGRTLTRAELAAVVGRALGEWARAALSSSWATPPIGQAAMTGRLCFGPIRGTAVTFVRADQWIGGWKDVDEQQSLREIVRRYLRAYGPATHQDFGQWFNILPAHARTLFDSIAGDLEQVEVDGRLAWVLRGDTAAGRSTRGDVVRLLPQYDCYLLGVRQREQIVPEPAKRAILDHGKGRMEGPVAISWLLINGVLAGVWDRQIRGKGLEIRVQPFRRLTPAQRESLAASVERIGKFLEAETTLRFG